MFQKLIFALFILSLFSCSTKEVKDFNQVKSSFIAEYSNLFPDEIPLPSHASQSDQSLDYLNTMLIPTNAMMDSIKQFSTKYNNDLKGLDDTALSPDDKKDLTKMTNILKTVDAFWAGRESNPETYNVLYNFQRILNADFKTPEVRLQIIFNKLEQVPQFYEAAKLQLKKAKVEKAEETIEKHLNTFTFFDETLPVYISQHHHMTPQYQARIDGAKYAVKDYIAYVESLRLN